MPSSEDVLKENMLSLLRISEGNGSKWPIFLEKIHLYHVCDGILEHIPRWTLATFMPGLPPRPEEVLTGTKIRQDELPRALEETEWDARNLEPDIILDRDDLYLTIEVKGDSGHFHGTGQPLLYARYLVLTPPGANLERKKRKRAFLLAAPRRFFEEQRFIMSTWEAWQPELRRLQEKDLGRNFYWGIVLGEEVKKVRDELLA